MLVVTAYGGVYQTIRGHHGSETRAFRAKEAFKQTHEHNVVRHETILRT